MRIPKLKSDRLVLRAPEPLDAAPLANYCAEFEISKNLSRVPYPYPNKAAREWIEKQSTGVAGINMAITQSDKLIGVVGFKSSTEREIGVFAPTIGYWLAAPFWGKGLMQEAVRRMLDWYMPIEPTEKICAAAFEDNPRSLNLLTKLGFTEVGRGTTYSLARGKDVPDVRLELTAERYYEATK